MAPTWNHLIQENVSEFDSEVDADGDLNHSATGVRVGTNGFVVTFDDTNAAYGLVDATAINRLEATLDVWFNPNSHVNTSGIMDLAYLVDGGGSTHWWLRIHKTGGGTWILRAQYRDDGGATVTAGTHTISSGTAWIHIRMSVKASSAPGADDGFVYLHVDDDGVISSYSDLTTDNDTRDWDKLHVGMRFANGSSTSGSFWFDEVGLSESSLSAAWTTQAIAGSITNTGSLVRTTLKVVAGSITNTGSLVRKTLKVVAGSITNTGALTTVKAVLSKLYTWTAQFRASDREDAYHAGSDEKRGRA